MTISLRPCPMMPRYAAVAVPRDAAAYGAVQVFLWRVPEDFSLHTEDEEPTDVSPIHKLSGHSRYVLEPHVQSSTDAALEK